jgi:hypothetical protein
LHNLKYYVVAAGYGPSAAGEIREAGPRKSVELYVYSQQSILIALVELRVVHNSGDLAMNDPKTEDVPHAQPPSTQSRQADSYLKLPAFLISHMPLGSSCRELFSSP